jgi:hypothetical protein
MEMKVLVGKIEYFAPNGASYTRYFDDEEEYLKAIADELNCNPSGFRHTTLVDDPAFRKRVALMISRIL